MKKNTLAELHTILPGTPDERRRFIVGALEELEAFHELTAPLARNLLDADSRLEKLEAASKQLARAVMEMNEDIWDRIELELITAMRQHGLSGNAAVERAAGAVAGIKLASQISRSARRLRTSMRDSTKRKGSPARMAFTALVKNLIGLYVRAYGKRPAASPAGYFSRAVAAICEGERIPAHLGRQEVARPSEEWLQKLINDVAAEAPAPRRGRKVRH